MALDVSLRLLRTFVAVAETGHVGRAAQRLFVSQPSVSQDIRRLERAARVELFERTSRGMELTPAGAAMLTGVRNGLLAVDRGATEAAALGGVVTRSVSIAFSPSVGNRLMPALIPTLVRALPGIAMDEREVDTGEVGPGVRDGRFDLGIAHCPSAESELHATPLFAEPACVAIAADHPLARRSTATVADLEGLDLVLWPRDTAPDYYDHLLSICASTGQPPRVVPGPRRAIIRSYLLSSRSTFCLLPASTASLTVPGVAFVPLTDDAARIPLVALRRRDDARPDVLAIEQLARVHAASLLAGGAA